MTAAAELKAYILAQLAVPVNEIEKILNSFNATIDFVTTEVSDVIPDWTNALTFQTDGTDDGKYCKHPSTAGIKRLFETKVDDNINHEPPTNPAITEDTYWKEVSASETAVLPEWAAGVFPPGLVIVYHNHSTDGRNLYILVEPVRPFTSANIETEITAGQWEKLGSTVDGGTP